MVARTCLSRCAIPRVDLAGRRTTPRCDVTNPEKNNLFLPYPSCPRCVEKPLSFLPNQTQGPSYYHESARHSSLISTRRCNNPCVIQTCFRRAVNFVWNSSAYSSQCLRCVVCSAIPEHHVLMELGASRLLDKPIDLL